MNIKDYSLSVWGEKAVTGQSRLQEYMIAEIGSLSMDSKCAALEPTLTQKVNGEMKLTFKMVTQYIEYGGKVKNPFVDYLINDRTVKLYRDGEWYDFVITSIEQNTDDNTNTYECTASHIYELSKNGYGLVYNSEINNDQGTITELATTVLDETDWAVDDESSEPILEKKRNALYTIVTNAALSVEEVLSGSTTTIPFGATVYAFYDSIYNKDDKVQLIYGTDEAQLDDNNCVLNWTNYYVSTTYYEGTPTWANTMTYTTSFEGYRYVLVERNLYDTAINERVGVYTDDNDNTYYKRTITKYASSAIVNNLTTGAETFNVDSNGNLPGWTLVNANPVVESHDGKNWLKLTPNSSSKATYAMNSGLVDNASVAGPISKGDKLYVRLTLGVNYSSITTTQGENVKVFIKNSTIDANGDYVEGDDQLTDTVSFSDRNINPLIPGYFTYNSDNIPVSFTSITGATPTPNNWILDLSCADDGSKINGSYLNFYRVDSSGHFYLTGEGAKFYWSNRSGVFGSDVELGQSGYIYVFRGNGTLDGNSGTAGQMFITTQEYDTQSSSNPKLIYNRITDPSTTTLVNYAWVTLTANKSLSAEDIVNSGYKIILKQDSGSMMTLTIGDFYVSKKETYEVTDVTGNYTRDIQIFVGSTPIGQTSVEYKYYDPDTVTSLDNLIYIDPTTIQGLRPVYNDYAKIRSIEASKSNRFNILQTICEKFEAWIKFTIEHNPNGTIKIGEDGAPIKRVSFHEYIGKDNYAGFVYGLNLEGITRTINSENIVSKLYVEPNTHEGADGGYCTIQKSDSNTLGEEFIYNFDYYINRGLLSDSAKNEIYGDNGYFTRVAEINRPRNQLVTAQSLINVSLQQVEARENVYTLAVDSITQQIEEERNKLLAWDTNIPANYRNTPEAAPYILGACVGIYHMSDGTTDSGAPDQQIIAIVETINELKRRLSLAKVNATNASQEVNRLSGQYEDIQDQLNDIQQQKDEIFEEFEKKYNHYIREGSWSSNDYGDNDLYYLDAVIVSQTNAQPKVEYQIRVIDISAIDGYEYIDFAIGDKTTVEDADFFGVGIKQSVIISELKRVLDDPSQDEITVQNYKTQFEDLFSRIEASIQTVEMKEGAYNRAASVVGNNGAIDVEAMVNSLYQLGQSGLGNTNPVSSIIQDSEGITSIDKNSSYKQLKIMDGKIYMTNNGGISWEPIVTPEGINVSYLKAGKIDTSQINIMSGNNAKFVWDKVGINAYATNDGNVDYSKFVRLDQYGIYGINANSGNKYYLSYSFEPSSVSAIENNENTTFALTWNGFLLRSKADGNLFTIDSTSGLTLRYGSAANPTTTINLGKSDTGTDHNAYGLNIKDGAGNTRLFAGKENNAYNFYIKDASGNSLFSAMGLDTQGITNMIGDLNTDAMSSSTTYPSLIANKMSYVDTTVRPNATYSISTLLNGFVHNYLAPDGSSSYLIYDATVPSLTMALYNSSGTLLNNKLVLSTTGITFKDSSGNEMSKFTPNEISIGRDTSALNLRPASVTIKDTEGDDQFKLTANASNNLYTGTMYFNGSTNGQPEGYVYGYRVYAISHYYLQLRIYIAKSYLSSYGLTIDGNTFYKVKINSITFPTTTRNNYTYNINYDSLQLSFTDRNSSYMLLDITLYDTIFYRRSDGQEAWYSDISTIIDQIEDCSTRSQMLNLNMTIGYKAFCLDVGSSIDESGIRESVGYINLGYSNIYNGKAYIMGNRNSSYRGYIMGDNNVVAKENLYVIGANNETSSRASSEDSSVLPNFILGNTNEISYGSHANLYNNIFIGSQNFSEGSVYSYYPNTYNIYNNVLVGYNNHVHGLGAQKTSSAGIYAGGYDGIANYLFGGGNYVMGGSSNTIIGRGNCCQYLLKSSSSSSGNTQNYITPFENLIAGYNCDIKGRVVDSTVIGYSSSIYLGSTSSDGQLLGAVLCGKSLYYSKDTTSTQYGPAIYGIYNEYTVSDRYVIIGNGQYNRHNAIEIAPYTANSDTDSNSQVTIKGSLFVKAPYSGTGLFHVYTNGYVNIGGNINSKVQSDTTISTVISWTNTSSSDGVTITSVDARRWGRLCMLTISFTNKSARGVTAYGNVTDTNIFDVATAFRPPVVAHFSCGGMQSSFGGTIEANGTVTIRDSAATGSTRNIATSQTCTVRAVYLLNNNWGTP